MNEAHTQPSLLRLREDVMRCGVIPPLMDLLVSQNDGKSIPQKSDLLRTLTHLSDLSFAALRCILLLSTIPSSVDRIGECDGIQKILSVFSRQKIDLESQLVSLIVNCCR